MASSWAALVVISLTVLMICHGPVDSLAPITHRNYTQMTALLNNISAVYPGLTRLYSVGKSVQGRELWVMEISDHPTLRYTFPVIY